jgi:hypothetical protein
MICAQANCYSNCHIDYKSNIPHDLNGFFEGSCDKCNHSLWNHHRCRDKWEQVVNTKMSVDQITKKWEAAEDGKEKTRVLVGACVKVLRDLDRVISRATNELERLVQQYADLSLSGSFSAQAGSAVKLLEQNYAALEEKGVGPEQLQKVKRSLDHMKRKLELLNKAKEVP